MGKLLSDKNLKIVATLALLVIAFAYVAPVLGLSSIGAGGGVSAPVVSTSGACPDSKLATLMHKVTYFDTSTGTDAQAATTASVYLANEKTVTVSGTTNTTGYAAIGTVPCGSGVTVFYGDGGTNYYFQEVKLSPSQTNQAYVYLEGKPKRSSTISLTYANTTTMGASSTSVAVGLGQTNTDVTLTVKGGAYYFGDGAFEVCAVFNTGNFTKVSFGSNAIEIPADPTISVSAGQAIKCYEVQQQLYNFNVIQLPVVIQAKPGVDPASTSIGIWVNDKSAYIKNGQLIPGYFNTDTLADLGLASVGSATAISVT